MEFKQIAAMIVVICALFYIMSTLFTFLDIGFNQYGVYLLWFVALAIFFFILPKSKANIFALS